MIHVQSRQNFQLLYHESDEVVKHVTVCCSRFCSAIASW